MNTGRDSFVPRTALDPVTVLDVRHRSLSEADGATDEVTSRLVVIDCTEALPGNDKFYESLLGNPLVSRVLCLAVGVNTTANQGSSVVQPRALFHSRRVGVLWIGDLTGVRWSPRTNEARAVGGGPVDANISNIDDLVLALRHEEVFDQVFAACDRMPENTASPGIQLVTAGVASDAVAGVQFDALSHVASDSRSEVSDKFRTAVLELGYEPGAEVPVLVPRSELDGARADAEAALDDAKLAVEQLAGLGALFGEPRPGQHVFAHVNRAARCVELFGGRAHLLLVRMDGNLQTGEPSISEVTALGVDEPARVRRDDMTSRLRECVQSALLEFRSIAVLRRACGHAAAMVAPQGCADALQEVDALLRPLGAPPRFPSWPVPVWAAPFILLGCLLGGLTPGSSPVGEVLVVLLALVWWALGWLLLARRPTDDVDTGEAGFASSAMAAALVYGLPALVGAGMGVLVAHYLEPRSGLVSDDVRWAALAVSVLMLAMACALSWPRAVRRWSRQLELEQWRAISDRLVGVLLDAIRSRWRLSSLQQALSDSLIQVADGLSEIQSVLNPQRCELAADTDQRAANGHRTDSVAAGPVDRSDVTSVVVDDLVDLAGEALRPCWPAIKGGTQLSPGRVGRAAEELVEDYRQHLLNPGLLALPPCASHDDSRARLAVNTDDSRARLAVNTWRRYRDGLDALSVNPTDYMTQLCGKDDLGTVRRSGVPAGVVRFGPLVLKEVLSEEGRPLQPVVSRDVLWTPGGGVAGSLRLSALMPGTVVADESVPAEIVPAEELE